MDKKLLKELWEAEKARRKAEADYREVELRILREVRAKKIGEEVSGEDARTGFFPTIFCVEQRKLFVQDSETFRIHYQGFSVQQNRRYARTVRGKTYGHLVERYYRGEKQ